MSDPDTVIVNAMHLAMQRLEAVHDEVNQLMQIHAKVTQEVQEATDLLRKILAITRIFCNREGFVQNCLFQNLSQRVMLV